MRCAVFDFSAAPSLFSTCTWLPPAAPPLSCVTCTRYCSALTLDEPPNRRAEEALVLLLHLGLGIGVAHEVQALLPVAVLDGEADPVEREADAAPGAVERLVHLQKLGAVVAFHAARRGRCDCAAAAISFAFSSCAPSFTISRRRNSASSSGSEARGCQAVLPGVLEVGSRAVV